MVCTAARMWSCSLWFVGIVFNVSHRKKSQGVRSGDLGGQSRRCSNLFERPCMWVLRTLNLTHFNLHDITVPHMHTGCTNFIPLHSVKKDNKFYCYMILENCHICMQFCVCVSSNNNSQQFCNVHCLQWMLQTFHTFPRSSQNNLETSKLYDDWVLISSWTWCCAVWCVVPNVSNECSNFTLNGKRSKTNTRHGTDEEIWRYSVAG